MEEHKCLHEEDFGVIFTKMDYMVDIVEGLRISVDALLKYMYSNQAINSNYDKRRLSARQWTGIIISGIIGISGIVCSIILKI